ncbi:hypothetical protein [Microbacterium sp.]|uniref:hypothetical protein n=1 Tax=Microbacterium sp. TaxID=51671 RepID=UPI0039E5C1F3
MTSDPDDALTWEGDDETPAASASPALPHGWKAVGKGSEAVPEPGPHEPSAGGTAASVPDERREAHAGLSTAMLLTLGVVGGVYLLYTIGWIIGGLRLKPLANLIVADWMFLPWFVLAITAPAIWFLVTWVLTRGRAAWIRVAMLLLGVVLLVPWPFVSMGVIGA